MKTRSQKQEELKMLKETLPKSKITIFTTFARDGEKGLGVKQSQELKKSLRTVQGEYLTAKKSLIDIACKDLNYDGVDVFGMDGSMALVIGHDDPYATAKKLYEFAKKNQALQFFGGVIDNSFLTKEQIMEMATMPSKEVLLARLFGMMKYPISALAMVLNQIAKQKEGAVTN
jgi:large subunit ribosomal protein L10